MITLFGKPGEGSLTRRGFLRVGGMAAEEFRAKILALAPPEADQGK